MKCVFFGIFWKKRILVQTVVSIVMKIARLKHDFKKKMFFKVIHVHYFYTIPV